MPMASLQGTIKYKYVAVPPCQKEFTRCKISNGHAENVTLDSSSEISDTDSGESGYPNHAATVLRNAQLQHDEVYLRSAKYWKQAFRFCLFCLSICIIAVTIAAASYFIRYDPQWKVEDGSCFSRSCVLAASGIASSLDESVNPCEDFFGFACGGWKNHNAIPVGKSYYDAFDKQERRVKASLKKLLEEDCSEYHSQHSAKCKAKAVYKACNDMDAIDARGIIPLKNLIDRFDGWSVAGNWNQSTFNLNRLYKNIAPYDVDIFFKIGVDLDVLNTSHNRIMIYKTGLTLQSPGYYVNKTLDDPTLKAYHTFMTDAAVLLGGERAASSRLMGNVLEFEIKLAAIDMVDSHLSDESGYRVLTFAELQELSSSFAWKDIIQSLFAGVGILEFTEAIGTEDSEYLRKLSDLIRRTSTETINNYVIWHLARTFMVGLGKDYVDLTTRLDQNLYGSSDSCNARWLWCVSFAEKHLPLPTGHLFIERHLDTETKNMANVMVEEIKDSFKRNVRRTSWLDEDTVNSALQKVTSLKNAIGYPDIAMKISALDSLFLELNATSKAFFDMILELHIFSFKRSLRKLLQSTDTDDWTMRATALNAYYSQSKNEIILPAGILQPPAYKSDYPQSVNFGGIGFVVAHELTHGFDDSGRRYDSRGNLHEWWENDTLTKFYERSECLVNQYSQFNSFGAPIDGVKTLSENIADNGGLRLAYDAYMNWKSTEEGINDPLLPSLNYTHEQLFFISFAQAWCAIDTMQHARQFVVKATHCSNAIRITGSLRNTKEFANAFHCRAGSKMNPEKKCVVW